MTTLVSFSYFNGVQQEAASTTGVQLPHMRAHNNESSACVRKQLVSWLKSEISLKAKRLEAIAIRLEAKIGITMRCISVSPAAPSVATRMRPGQRDNPGT